MNGISLLGCALGARLAQSYFQKRSSQRLEGASKVLPFTAFQYSLCAVLALVLSLVTTPVTAAMPLTLLISLLGGCALAFNSASSYLALGRGAIMLVSVADMSGMAIPCVAGALFFGEAFTWRQACGILLLCASTLLMLRYNASIRPQGGKGKTAFLLVAVFLMNGLTMTAQKMFTYYQPGVDVWNYTFWSFLFAALAMWIFLLAKRRPGQKAMLLPDKKSLPPLAVLACCVLVINQTITQASAQLPALFLFPMFSGLGLVLTALLSAFVFHEPLCGKSIAGMAAAVTALVLMNLPS